MEHAAAFMKLWFFFLCVLIFLYKAGKTEKIMTGDMQFQACWPNSTCHQLLTGLKLAFENILTFVQIFLGITEKCKNILESLISSVGEQEHWRHDFCPIVPK